MTESHSLPFRKHALKFLAFPAMAQLLHFTSLYSLLPPFGPPLIPVPRHLLLPADPSVGGAQRQKRARLADDLSEKIQRRPSPLELHKKNRIPLENSEWNSPPHTPLHTAQAHHNTTGHNGTPQHNSTTQHNATEQHTTMQRNATQCNATQRNATQHNLYTRQIPLLQYIFLPDNY